jgi:hypothetical protein
MLRASRLIRRAVPAAKGPAKRQVGPGRGRGSFPPSAVQARRRQAVSGVAGWLVLVREQLVGAWSPAAPRAPEPGIELLCQLNSSDSRTEDGEKNGAEFDGDGWMSRNGVPQALVHRPQPRQLPAVQARLRLLRYGRGRYKPRVSSAEDGVQQALVPVWEQLVPLVRAACGVGSPGSLETGIELLCQLNSSDSRTDGGWREERRGVRRGRSRNGVPQALVH